MANDLTSTNKLVVKLVMLKGEKGDNGYDDTEIRGLINAETVAREREDGRLEDAIAEVVTPSASGIVYLNSISGLTATNAQDAIDEIAPVVDEMATLSDTVTTLSGDVTTLQGQIASTVEQVTMLASGWANSEYTITNALITATSVQEILVSENITDTQLKAYQKANIVCIGQITGIITVKAFGTVPTVDIPIQVIYRGVK